MKIVTVKQSKPAANDNHLKSTAINPQKQTEKKQQQLFAFYRQLKALEFEFLMAQSDKTQLQTIDKTLTRLIESNKHLIKYEAPQFAISTKWPTIATRSLSLYGTLSGLILFASTITVAAIAPIGAVALYTLYKAREDMCKAERSIRIEKKIVTAKESVMEALHVPVPKKPTTPTLNAKPKPSAIKRAATKIVNNVFNSTTRDALGMTGTILGVTGTSFALGIITANPIGLIVAGTIAIMAAVSYGIYERYKKNQLAKEKQDLIMRQQQLKIREEKLHQLETEQLKLRLAKNQSKLEELATKAQSQDKLINKLKKSNLILKQHNKTLQTYKKEKATCNSDQVPSQRFFNNHRK